MYAPMVEMHAGPEMWVQIMAMLAFAKQCMTNKPSFPVCNICLSPSCCNLCHCTQIRIHLTLPLSSITTIVHSLAGPQVPNDQAGHSTAGCQFATRLVQKQQPAHHPGNQPSDVKDQQQHTAPQHGITVKQYQAIQGGLGGQPCCRTLCLACRSVHVNTQELRCCRCLELHQA